MFTFLKNNKQKISLRIEANSLIKNYHTECVRIVSENKFRLDEDSLASINHFIVQTNGKSILKLNNNEFDSPDGISSLKSWLFSKNQQLILDIERHSHK